MIPGWGRDPGIGNGNSLLYLLAGKSHGEKNLVGYSACSHKSVNQIIILKNSNQGLWNNYKEQGMYTSRGAWWATVHGITKASEKT